MMIFVEVISFTLAIALCVICTKSDLSEGIIYNKVLVVFAVFAIIIDGIYYGYFARDIFFDFLPNFCIMFFISIYLFYSHSFAGGDCKMAIVLSLLYPARFYFVYGSMITTLFFSLGFAIFAGYVYLLTSALIQLVKKKVSLTGDYIKGMLKNFVKSYFSAMAYITLLNCILIYLSRMGISLNIWFPRLLCLSIALLIGRFKFLSKLAIVIPVYAIVVLISFLTKTIPISFNPENYILVLVLLLCQITIKTTIYARVKVDELKKGMILSTLSSVLMQKSITRGLPNVSTEDLKSRLSSEEIESIKLWARATRTEELTIVKKIPFAVFISIGFVIYFVIWSITI